MLQPYRILRYLADGRFYSGETLARSLGVSRAAVWKHLRTLRSELGTEVFAVRGKGYRLARPLELFDRDLIRSRMTQVGRRRLAGLDILPKTGSTNTYLLQQSRQGAPSGFACLAEYQSEGRGRRGRRWVSPFGSNIYLSVLWRYSLAPSQLSGLSLAAGVSVVRALRMLGVEGVGLKWPNDVVAEHRKLAGLLIEVVAEAAGPSDVVVGLGLNTCMPENPDPGIDQPWVDLQRLPGGAAVSRNQLAALLLENLLDALVRYEGEGVASILDEWNSYDQLRGRPVALRMGDRVMEGVHAGIDDTGALLLDSGGAIRAYHAGEVSLRPVGGA